MNVRKANKNDIPGMVKCHQETLRGKTSGEDELDWAEIGPTLLGCLYNCYIDNPHCVSLVAVDDIGRVVGLAVGGTGSVGNEFRKKAALRYFYLLPVKFFTNKNFRKWVIGKFASKLYGSEKHDVPPEDAQFSIRKSGFLAFMGVIENCQGGHVGTLLMQRFLSFFEQDHETVRLTVHADNLKARRFYEKIGWVVAYESRGGCTYIKSFNDKDKPIKCADQ